jgi:hypothetical protein
MVGVSLIDRHVEVAITFVLAITITFVPAGCSGWKNRTVFIMLDARNNNQYHRMKFDK